MSSHCTSDEQSTPDKWSTCGDSGVGSDVLRLSAGGQSFRVVPSHDPRFWKLVTAGGWEPDTFVVLNRMLSGGTPYVDCGAWIGPTVLYAACKGARVTAFECDPVAIQ